MEIEKSLGIFKCDKHKRKIACFGSKDDEGEILNCNKIENTKKIKKKIIITI